MNQIFPSNVQNENLKECENNESAKKKHVLILSFTSVLQSPRESRQISFFLSKGWNVSVAGYTSSTDIAVFASPSFSFMSLNGEVAKDTVSTPTKRTRSSFYSSVRRGIFTALRGLSFIPGVAVWSSLYLRSDLRSTFSKISDLENVDLIVAHGYLTLPVAYRLSKRWGCSFVVDMHEHSRTQHQTMHWWKNFSWYIRDYFYTYALEKKFLPRAKAITTVSPGIAQDLEKNYSLPRVHVVRSTPFYQKMPLKLLRPDSPITFLYHGFITPRRGIAMCIRAIALAHPRCRLIIRGIGDKMFIQSLQNLAHNVAPDRIFFAPPVAMRDLVRAANESADVGLFVTNVAIFQRRYGLPNKFFEYTMAGLALLLVDFPEFRTLIDLYGHGVLLSDPTPQRLAEAMSDMSWDRVNAFKEASLKAAHELCWEKEQLEMERAYGLCDNSLRKEL